jgi:glucose-6-phosphate-specific signal transduction histidine kinase
MEKTVEINDIEQVSQGTQSRGALASTWTFIRHLLEMCLAMCIGGIPLIILFFVGAAKIGYPDLFQQSPTLSVLVVSFILSLPMVAWMRFRGHDWRSTLEMASTTIVLGVLLVTLSWLGILPESSLFELLTRFACPVMLIPMFFRLDLYTGRSGHCH